MPKVSHYHVVHSAAHGRVMIANCCHFKDPQLVVSSGGEYINLICVPNNGNLAKKHCESLGKLWDPWYWGSINNGKACVPFFMCTRTVCAKALDYIVEV